MGVGAANRGEKGKGKSGFRYIFICRTMELVVGAEGLVLPGVHTQNQPVGVFV